ncbi:MAG: fused MFS/spermidine synthase [Pseudomonadota bacterium]
MLCHRVCIALGIAVLSFVGFVGSAAADRPRLIEQRDSVYNSIFVHERDGLHIMSFGVNNKYFTESKYDPSNDRALPVVYTRYMTAALTYVPKADNLAEIGFGGGRTAAYLHLHMPQTEITAVEIDKAVLDLAQAHFGIVPDERLKLVARDGRLFLKRTKESFDVILIDAYRGSFVPFHLLTQEFFETVEARLNEGGVAVQNIEPSTMLYDRALITLRAVFDHVDVYPARGNIVAIAYNGPPRSQASLLARAETLQAEHDFYYPLGDLLADRRIVTTLPEGRPLTDDFAPVETLNAIERHNLAIDRYSEPAR